MSQIKRTINKSDSMKQQTSNCSQFLQKTLSAILEFIESKKNSMKVLHIVICKDFNQDENSAETTRVFTRINRLIDKYELEVQVHLLAASKTDDSLEKLLVLQQNNIYEQLRNSSADVI